MSRYNWTIQAIKTELGISLEVLRKLIKDNIIQPAEWDVLSETLKTKRLAEQSFLINAAEIKNLISKMLTAFMSNRDIQNRLDEQIQLQYEILSEIKTIKSDFDLSLEPMDIADIAHELKMSKQTLNNYIMKTAPGIGILPIPKNNPVYNIPMFMLKGKWCTQRFEFLRQKRGLTYGECIKFEKAINGK